MASSLQKRLFRDKSVSPGAPYTDATFFNGLQDAVIDSGGSSDARPPTTHSHDTIYPHGNPAGAADGQVWTYDAASGGYVPRAVPAPPAPPAPPADGAAGTPTMRSLGTGAVQATAGNDGRLTNARTPTAHGASHNYNGSDALVVEAVRLVGSAGQPGFQNGWANFGGQYESAGFYKGPDGRVYLSGLIAGGTIGLAPGGVCFTLPAGYAPASQNVFAAIATNALARLDVMVNGQVLCFSATASSYFSLSGISFRAA